MPGSLIQFSNKHRLQSRRMAWSEMLVRLRRGSASQARGEREGQGAPDRQAPAPTLATSLELALLGPLGSFCGSREELTARCKLDVKWLQKRTAASDAPLVLAVWVLKEAHQSRLPVPRTEEEPP